MTNKIKFPVMHGMVLGIDTYRGLASLSDLAKISRADIFDQKKNQTGTQRDLNVKHAREAYEYVATKPFGFWPEVILCCRDSSALDFKIIDKELNIGTLIIDIDIIESNEKHRKIAISRLDGNHRLHFADGKTDGFPPIDKPVSFCMLIGLTLKQEIQLFRDINNNLMRMNTSHLDNIELRLSGDSKIKQADPALYIAKKLSEDPESPFHGIIFEGGKKPAIFSIPLRALHTGTEYLRSKSTRLEELGDVDAEYYVIKAYWQALRQWEPDAWEDPKKYLLLRGAGLWGACFLGGFVIQKCLEDGRYEVSEMLKVLNSGRKWDWSPKGDFKGYSGRGGALEIAKKIEDEFDIESKVSMKKLAEKIKKNK